MVDKWFMDKFIEISDRLGRIEEHNEDQSKSIERAFKKIGKNTKRIRTLEDSNLVTKTKDRFYEKHPVKTAMGGTTAIGIIFAICAFVLDKLGII